MKNAVPVNHNTFPPTPSAVVHPWSMDGQLDIRQLLSFYLQDKSTAENYHTFLETDVLRQEHSA